MGREEFRVLLQHCGFALAERDLEEMKQATLLIELSDEVERPYCALHLFVVVKYMEAAGQPRHPWRADVPPRFERVRELAERVARVIDEVRGESQKGPSPNDLEQLGLEIERHVNLLDPFGPLADVIDIVREDVVERLRGHGRLYAELRASARGLDDLSEHYRVRRSSPAAPAVSKPSPATVPVHVPRMQDSEIVDEDEQAPEEILDDVLGTSSDVLRAPDPEEIKGRDPDEDTQEVKTGGLRTTQVMDDAKDESSEDSEFSGPDETTEVQQVSEAEDARPTVAPAGGVRVTAEIKPVARPEASKDEDEQDATPEPGAVPPPMPSGPRVKPTEGANPFMRQSPLRTTGETLALKSRLKALAPATEATEDEAFAETPLGDDAGASDEWEAEATQAMQPGVLQEDSEKIDATLAERIEELNTKRQELMKAKDWAGLVELYEGGIELFEGAERLQVLMTMARLQDKKLGDHDRAYLNLLRAVPDASGASLGGLLDEMHALVVRADMVADHEGWVQEFAADGELSAEDRPYVQRALARAMKAGGHGERAFLSYASYVVDHAAQALSMEALDLLEELAAEVSPEDLGGVYEEMLEHEQLGTEHEALVAARAGMRAVDSGDMEKGARYLKRSLGADPGDTAVFHALAATYEELEQWFDLANLYEEYVAANPGDAEGYAEAIERAKARASEDVEGTLDHYKARAEADATDVEALERVEQAYMDSERYAEGYAFLTQHLERVEESEHRVAILLSLARIAKDYLEAPQEAVIHYARIIDLVPDHMEALEAMHELGG